MVCPMYAVENADVDKSFKLVVGSSLSSSLLVAYESKVQ
jgi:hypothetical protein